MTVSVLSCVKEIINGNACCQLLKFAAVMFPFLNMWEVWGEEHLLGSCNPPHPKKKKIKKISVFVL